jgi:hypothetical protein
MFRFLVEYGMKVPVEDSCPSVSIKKGDKETILDFNGKSGYAGKPNIRAIIPAEDKDDALKSADAFLLPLIEKIMMVNRVRLIISPLHFVLEGATGKAERYCFVSRLWKKGPRFDIDHFSQENINDIVNTHFANANNIAVGFFRLAMLSSSNIDAFRNLRLALEALVPSKRRIRKCDNLKCKADLYCNECKKASTFDTVLDDDIRQFWAENMYDMGADAIDEVLELRQKAFHAAPLEKIFSKNLHHLNHRLEIALGFYFTSGSKFVPMSPDYGSNYYSEKTFRTAYPNEEFPQDFPGEEYWRGRIEHMNND